MGANVRLPPEADATTDRSKPFRLSARTCALIAPSIFAAAAAPAPALAQKWYGIAYQYGDFTGAEATLAYDCLSVPDTPPYFVSNNLWVLKDYTATRWVEAGITYGWFQADPYGGVQHVTTPSFFWADENGGGFFSHVGPAAAPHANHLARIRSDLGSGKWNVTIGGFTGTSRQTFLRAGMIQTGTETTTRDYARASSSEGGLAYWTQTGGRHDGWGSPTYGGAQLRQDRPPYANWKNPNKALVTQIGSC